MNALITSNLKDTLRLEEKSETSKKDKINKTTYSLIKSCWTQDIKYHVLYETSAKKMWEIHEKEYLTKSIESGLLLKRRLYRLQLKKRLYIAEHMNNYTNLLTDFINVDVNIKEEDKALILLNSLHDEDYGTLVLTLINDT